MRFTRRLGSGPQMLRLDVGSETTLDNPPSPPPFEASSSGHTPAALRRTRTSSEVPARRSYCRRDRCSTHATQHTGLGPQRTRHHSRGVSIRRTPAAAGASQPRSLLRRRTTTAGVSVRRKPAAAGAPFVRRLALLVAASGVVPSPRHARSGRDSGQKPLCNCQHGGACFDCIICTACFACIIWLRFTTEYPSSYPPRAISLRISSSSSQLAHETSTADSRRFTSHGTYASSSKVGKDIYMLIS